MTNANTPLSREEYEQLANRYVTGCADSDDVIRRWFTDPSSHRGRGKIRLRSEEALCARRWAGMQPAAVTAAKKAPCPAPSFSRCPNPGLCGDPRCDGSCGYPGSDGGQPYRYEIYGGEE